jgi:hypothetical protein
MDTRQAAVTASASPDRSGRRVLISGAVFLLSYFAARGIIESVEFGSTAAWLAAWLPAAPFAVLLWQLVRAVRGADELERRLHLEAMAVAFPVMMLLLMVLGLLEIAVPLDRDNWGYRHVWALTPVLYLGGLVLARRRYGQG